MKSKNSTPIGFLIEMLHISVKDMANEIFVDPTTISKWKTCERPLSSKCDSFEKVVKYVLSRNSKQNRRVLENLFSSIYGEKTYPTPDYVESCLRQFLDNATVPTEAKNIAIQTKGGLYSCMTNIYSGIEGRKASMEILLNNAESTDNPGELLFFDRQLFAWFIFDDQYRRNWEKRIVALLEVGWQISVIIDCSASNQVLSVFMYCNNVFYAFPNYKEFTFNSVRNINLLPTVYILRGKTAVFGFNTDKTLYTNVMQDKFTLEHGYFYLNNLISECAPTLSPKTTKGRVDVFNKIIGYEVCDEATYLYSSSLSLIALSDELINQVLYENCIVGELKSSLLKAVQAIRQNVLDSKEFYRHVLYLNPALLSYEKVYCKEFSFIVGKDIYMTREVFIEHLRQTVHMIRGQNNYSVSLPGPMDRLPSEHYLVRCKNKLYTICVGDEIRFSAESSMVTTVFGILDEHWKTIPAENKDTDRVTKYLLGLIGE